MRYASAMIRARDRRRALWVGACMLAAFVFATPAHAACAGDCNADGAVGVDELVTLVNIALGDAGVSNCSAGDVNQDGQITIDEIVAAVSSALDGCPSSPPVVRAALHFDQPQEAINQELVGSVQSAPLADANQLLRSVVHPASMRLDAGFENSGCPDGSVSGPLYDASTNTFNDCQLDARLEQSRAVGASPLVIIDYTPLALGDAACVASNGHGRGAQLCPPGDLEKYASLVEAMVQHVYVTFGVTDFEVWNEPDGFFFAGT